MTNTKKAEVLKTWRKDMKVGIWHATARIMLKAEHAWVSIPHVHWGGNEGHLQYSNRRVKKSECPQLWNILWDEKDDDIDYTNLAFEAVKDLWQ